MNLPKIEQDETPRGKRSIRSNIWGNIVGYVSGIRWQEFGTDNISNRRMAEAWKNGDPNWQNA